MHGRKNKQWVVGNKDARMIRTRKQYAGEYRTRFILAKIGYVPLDTASRNNLRVIWNQCLRTTLFITTTFSIVYQHTINTVTSLPVRYNYYHSRA